MEVQKMKRYIVLIASVLVLTAAVSVTAQMMGRGGMMGWGTYGRGYGWGDPDADYPGWGGPGMMGPGMVNAPWNYIPPGDVKPMSIEEAAEQVEQYLDSWGNPDLKLAEIMEFSNHFYAEIEEESTEIHAFELLVNKWTGHVFPEPGPSMMWNVKYGHMGGGMMGGPGRRGSPRYGWQDPTEPMKLKPAGAIEKAQKYLDSLYPGLKADKEVDRFYGYYTIHTLKEGKVYGMLSVNGYTGDVWYHTWHGRFVGMKEQEGEKHM
jgi:hypothetical protein